MINLKDKLSHLTFRGACKLLGHEGERLIRTGGRYDIDISEEVVLRKDLFQLNLDGPVITILLDSEKDQRLDCQCSVCTAPCEHIGAALSLILEEKLILGLSARHLKGSLLKA